jgi:hypothetical protein
MLREQPYGAEKVGALTQVSTSEVSAQTDAIYRRWKRRVCAVRLNASPTGGKSGKIGVAKRAAIVGAYRWQGPSSPRRSALTNLQLVPLVQFAKLG